MYPRRLLIRRALLPCLSFRELRETWSFPMVLKALAEGILKTLQPEPFREAAAAGLRVADVLTRDTMAEATLDVYRAVIF